MPLCEMEVRSSQCHALAEDTSPNEVLSQEDMKDRVREKQKKCEAKSEPALWERDQQTRTCREAQLIQKKKSPQEKKEMEMENKEFGFNLIMLFCIFTHAALAKFGS